MNKTNLLTEPYKGVRDFYPEDMRVRNYFFDKIREVIEGNGFEEYDASILERSELYRAKTGEEIVNEQTYNFVDRGDREVTLRPEMTPSVARMVARKRKELAFPLKWFNIGRRYRYERMQKGRMREFWQLDCDVFGVDEAGSDVEMISLPCGILQSFGAKDTQYEVRINHRGLVNWILNDYLKLDPDQSYAVGKLIDRKDKIENEKFELMLEESVQEKKDKLLELLEVDGIEVLKAKIGDNVDLKRMELIFEGLERMGITNYRYDPTLMRGFDYYTGVVFEVFDTDKQNPRSIFGGGRYDDLVSIFGAEKVCGIGFGMGDVVIMDFLNDYDLMPSDDELRKGVYICVLNDEAREHAEEVSKKMREKGRVVEIDYSGKKVGDQIRLADRKGRKYVVCIGENEMSTGKLQMKDLVSGETSEIEW